MSYQVDFKGYFEYNDELATESALKIVDKELTDPDDDFETSCFRREDFDRQDTKLLIDFSGTIPASCWYGCMRVLYKISTHAIKGEIKCKFEGDAAEWVEAGTGY